MNDKCPKCGSNRKFHQGGFTSFACDTDLKPNGKLLESYACLKRQLENLTKQCREVLKFAEQWDEIKTSRLNEELQKLKGML